MDPFSYLCVFFFFVILPCLFITCWERSDLLSLLCVFCVFLLISHMCLDPHQNKKGRERSSSVVECLTQDRRAVGSSLTGVTALCP